MVLGGDLRTKKEYETHGGEQFVLVSSLEPVLRRQNASVCAKGLELLLLIANCSSAALLHSGSMSLAEIITSGPASDDESATYVELWKFLVVATNPSRSL